MIHAKRHLSAMNTIRRMCFVKKDPTIIAHEQLQVRNERMAQLKGLAEATVKGILGEANYADVFFLDANLVIHYINNTIPQWNAFVDGYFAHTHRKMYLMPITWKEVNYGDKLPTGLPPCFEVLSLPIQDHKPEDALNKVFLEIIHRLSITNAKTAMKLQTNIKTIALGGYYAATAAMEHEDLLEATIGGTVVFGSNNFKCIRALLKTKEKQAMFEGVLNDNGFEHLITVRHVSNIGTFEDYF